MSFCQSKTLRKKPINKKTAKCSLFSLFISLELLIIATTNQQSYNRVTKAFSIFIQSV